MKIFQTHLRKTRGDTSVEEYEMTSYYDEIEIEDFEWDEETETYYYPCPCGDKFLITKEELINGEEVATCPSCSLLLKVIYDQDQFQAEQEEVTVTVIKSGVSITAE